MIVLSSCDCYDKHTASHTLFVCPCVQGDKIHEQSNNGVKSDYTNPLYEMRNEKPFQETEIPAVVSA